ncbi:MULTISPECIES: bifunctional proline dehydrogenase/L-glutamate gamma-semialdehyde dehydrogenase PutA [Chromohalobacter]|uniref:Bifunctional protein PutA n=1 Tax=Chromohalobacter israelensis (strain ATCC BAA-138 / DSM 3043 / CIP 106854 / NCIMB 13768 / 1H11) TaxID=290398 RepID=Q1QY54_CHRI1|nr:MULTISPECIES: bifunctional proline dehydrogenase/L-glutamate gamma-semialdehyde dehydrogenase PutA [Chromohalobacter]ABE58604.1 L-proline dehydrogenase / delta-1-pyrroline-5-carboxylate dehydrogenase [Chromohalobacter salexigens DSM 3043]MDF9433077.1 bifunctional proline dehydrogenase/L-glutamate gamma-semialdehyde dehydrogenase PutA [Chromohalobacter israelensis]MDO0944726.1 bifunctional proline dehydrogenase/L-glutamate gamma-semialdehyde dehydrogenase PutA [Chromohalobacter salexigens]NQY
MLNANTMLENATWNDELDTLFARVSDHYSVDENAYVAELAAVLRSDDEDFKRIAAQTAELVRDVRDMDTAVDSIDELLQEYSLDTHEGLMLMCLAEAMLRIPDKATADALIEDKLGPADWKAHVGQSESWFVNASTWGLLMTGRVLQLDHPREGKPANFINKMVNRMGEPVIRRAMYQAMKIMGKQFVLGRTIDEALKRSQPLFDKGYTYSYDMLGEAARTRPDAGRYYDDYANAIARVGATSRKLDAKTPSPSVSIKLSALHPRYEFGRRSQVLDELVDSVRQLVTLARENEVAITIDAEEADRLELSLEVFRAVFESDVCRGWGHFGLVVQAYSKRALPVLHYLNRLADQCGDEIPLRLVKGAYWDTEIKEAQQQGLDGYPVFTRKAGTDVAYLACVHFLLSEETRGRIFPQFATHNAHTISTILELANDAGRHFEFQRLHGMGEALYEVALKRAPQGTYCRIYAPVGAHKDLLPYLVRRLLENGANSSFVHQLVDPRVPVESLCVHPLETLSQYETYANSRIPLPRDIYGEKRKNSKGVNLNINSQYQPLIDAMASFMETEYHAKPLLAFTVEDDAAQCHDVLSPYDTRQRVGDVQWTTSEQARRAVDAAWAAFPRWTDTPVEERAAILERFADLLETHLAELMTLCSREGGKLLTDGVDEIREAVDFCRYYAMRAREMFDAPIPLPGPTGESNELILSGKGVFAAISPWNFPVAIFCGQMVAAAVAGNPVLAKPAEQTSLIAHRVVELLHEAGMPRDVVQLLPGDGPTVGSVLTGDARITGVVFTGGTDTAQIINRALADREGAALPTLIAETGGMNAMIVDSTALPEQVVVDVVGSAFQSAGQRCSALRVLYLQEDIADRVIEILKGAMAELHIGDPRELGTDVGPVIDEDAHRQLSDYIARLKEEGRLVAEATPDPDVIAHGHFIAPTAFEVEGIEALEREQFGPILHIARYRSADIDQVIDTINAKGYGLTFGVHSRNESFAAEIARKIRVGNVYVNRNIIGAVVGVQPFGGQGLSGTGPKAGGPHYLQRFATEKTRTINTAALGGNASLLALGDE